MGSNHCVFSDLPVQQTGPFTNLGKTPLLFYVESRQTNSNRQRVDYKSTILPIELYRLILLFILKVITPRLKLGTQGLAYYYSFHYHIIILMCLQSGLFHNLAHDVCLGNPCIVSTHCIYFKYQSLARRQHIKIFIMTQLSSFRGFSLSGVSSGSLL